MNVAGRIVVLGAIVVAGACDSPTEYRADELRATASPPRLTLTNTSDKRIAYMVADRDFLALALFTCLSPDSPILPPSGELTLQYSSIPGYEPGKSKAALIWFATVRAGDSGCIDSARQKTLLVHL